MSKLLRSSLKFWAKKYLKRVKPEIIAVSGSVGKTSTKEAIFEVLKVKFGDQIRKSEGNLNNETGLPLAILDYKKAPSYGSKVWEWFPIVSGVPLKCMRLKNIKILVLEYAADRPGDISYLLSIAKPKIAVLTYVGPAHLSAFGTIDKIAQEKSKLIEALPKDGWAVLNIDNRQIKKISHGGSWQTKTYGIIERANVEARDIETNLKDLEAKTTFQANVDDETFPIELQTLGDQGNVYAALAAIAVGKIYNLTNSQITEGLLNVQSEKHRMQIIRGKKNTIIIDDSYNANPISMKAALTVLKRISNRGRKIAVLGDMLEINQIADEAHKLIGEYAKEVADIFVSVGKLAKIYQADHYFTDKAAVIEYLLKEIKAGDILLIKASRSLELWDIAETLKDK